MSAAMVEVLIAGAGPAGTVAATVLARAGVRVLVIERATFPRDKLCGDTLNPGALALLRRLGASADVEDRGLALEGMVVTNGAGLRVKGRYGQGLTGRAIPRRDLDMMLLQVAVRAGARVEIGARVLAPLVDESGGRIAVRGALVEARGRKTRLPACVTIAADGRRSALAVSLGLARHPTRSRRWAVGAYFSDVADLGCCGELHLRSRHYLGVAPIAGGLANACLVTPPCVGLRDPAALLDATLASDPWLADRFAGARRATPVTSLGPLAVDARAVGLPGLLLAGDAAGFIDPMTGDGLRFAIEGGWLAAETALELLEQPQLRAWRRLERRRRRRFGMKRGFDRALRALVAWGAAGRAGELGAPVAPALLRGIIAEAGDVRLARRLARTAAVGS